MVLDEKRLVLKGIPMGSWVKPTMGTGTGKTRIPVGLPVPLATNYWICLGGKYLNGNLKF